ncbi:MULTISPECIES: hypothetical protein [Paenibacillus]|jgi:hypothetical protein|uniref:Uncharacterized protein n=1 Tax=Paenibacillus polymyxa TaxID=1406 RepID=A0ABX2ZBJ1_PAEPO|nr:MULTISPECIES: hypothetical protein [Paenibacillus]ADM69346.1 hypothetical protein PPE_01507 [Paenibacillus polymyxa E681]MBP1175457.1 hypothetical protein [Paenibacillus sp. PvR133]MDY8026067.1 hypothetical protein [Paenibacillus polymyxa]MXO77483.1 hypothetical protein [Paenibacillus sp. OT2-17]ODA08839.1 hypothetical protein A7312_05395 [Paenibacillus polymyxa]
MGYDSLIKAILSVPKEELTIQWGSGLKIIGTRDTIYETNNGLDEDDNEFIEYDAAVIEVKKIVSKPINDEGSIYNWLQKGKSPFIEISLHNDPPSMITSTDGSIIWKYE